MLSILIRYVAAVQTFSVGDVLPPEFAYYINKRDYERNVNQILGKFLVLKLQFQQQHSFFNELGVYISSSIPKRGRGANWCQNELNIWSPQLSGLKRQQVLLETGAKNISEYTEAQLKTYYYKQCELQTKGTNK
ncbi:Hypothetical_protein [Hexamita inflata]|uniref:Hypothetical_protein n=1 Tax=Hexamita inflata TaxID=28002 RepID=A0AA86UR90_9EUKA|nr:Hypothetical protein HINF_LOCUS49292 [Hexamita inflata]